MENWELFITAIGLSMDAFAVAVSKGLTVREEKAKKMLLVGIYFGGFQAFMPLLGYFVGEHFKRFITGVDHWVAFLILAFLGGHMIREAGSEEESVTAGFDYKTMLMLAVATSIDALAVGVTLAVLEVDIFVAVTCIGTVTFLLSAAGVFLGNLAGEKIRVHAVLIGGGILIFIGAKILLQHTGILG